MIHAAKVTDVRVYSKGDAQTDTLDRNASPVDYKIANFLDRVNEAPVSKHKLYNLVSQIGKTSCRGGGLI